MRSLHISAALSAALTATLAIAPAHARQTSQQDQQQEKPITSRDPDAMDVVKTPVTDLNLGRGKEIPPILNAAVANPYALEGLHKCRQLADAIEQLDTVLGPDIDLPQQEPDRISEGRVAKTVVSSLIPFRGLIREISGANAQDQKVRAAIQAGLARRGFLKGFGAARGCKYPASPAPAAVVQALREQMQSKGENDHAESMNPDRKTPDSDTGESANGVTFTSQPVVQPIP